MSTYNVSLSIANVYDILMLLNIQKQKPAHIQPGILSGMNRVLSLMGFINIIVVDEKKLILFTYPCNVDIIMPLLVLSHKK